MRPAPFRYFAPTSIEEAKTLLVEHGEEARLLAGGQSLVPLMNLRMVRPSVLIDLNRARDLDTIALGEDGRLVFGPMVRQRDAELSPVVAKNCPLISLALAHAGPLAVRTRATVGGTLAHADRTAELPGVAVALGATFFIDGPDGARMVPASDFFRGDLTTAVEATEMLTSVHFPAWPEGEFAIFLESGTRQRDLAVAGIAVCLRADGERCRDARVAVVGVSSTPFRLAGVEEAILADGPSASTVREAARQALANVEMVSDVHATADYRRHLVVALIEKAMAAAVDHRARHDH
jgi:CO/xanthine dehydrogenase FAD-binding subunit